MCRCFLFAFDAKAWHRGMNACFLKLEVIINIITACTSNPTPDGPGVLIFLIVTNCIAAAVSKHGMLLVIACALLQIIIGTVPYRL